MTTETQTTQTTTTTQAPPGGADAFATFVQTLPDNMRGTDAMDTLTKLAPSWKGYHDEWTKREPVLKDVKDFTLDISNEKAKPFFDAKSPMAAAFTKAAVESGLTKTQAGKLANAVMGELAEGGHLGERMDVKAAMTEMAKALGHTELNDAAKTAYQTWEKESAAYLANMGQQMKLSERSQGLLDSIMDDPGGPELIKAFQAMGGGSTFKLGGTGAGSSVKTKDDVFAMLNDDRYNSNSPKFDKAFRAQADAAYDALRAQS